jgi:hypothetical protein
VVLAAGGARPHRIATFAAGADSPDPSDKIA